MYATAGLLPVETPFASDREKVDPYSYSYSLLSSCEEALMVMDVDIVDLGVIDVVVDLDIDIGIVDIDDERIP